ncbi:hypothetical protein [Succinimonas sp.]|uniref:hypothetical protein n=1 Tax=Succinimonas sp. TaxID=1936151 RepID=UPI0038679FCC
MANEKRLIDANPIVQFIMDGLNNPDKLKALGHDAIEILAEIEFADTVDAVEVVRCKDCIYATEDDGLLYCDGPIGIFGTVGFNDFCSCGERREGE